MSNGEPKRMAVVGVICTAIGVLLGAGALVWADGSVTSKVLTTQQANVGQLNDHEERLRVMEGAMSRHEERWRQLEKSLDRIEGALGTKGTDG